MALILFALYGGPGVAQDVEWRYDYNAARREALEKGRPLVIDFGTPSCFWCKKLDTTTFHEPAVIQVMNERFIPLKINAQEEAFLSQALRIQSYPTIVLAAPTGKILDTLEGYTDAPRFYQRLQGSLTGMSGEAGEALQQQRLARARELLEQAQADFRAQQFLCCLDRCDLVMATYSDLPEAAAAERLAAEVKADPERMRQASDRLATLYLALAENLRKQGQSQQAMLYLERVIDTAAPASPHAETAQARLSQILAQPSPPHPDN